MSTTTKGRVVCGICEPQGEPSNLSLRRMTRAMAHRAPDGAGIKLLTATSPAGLGPPATRNH